MAKDTNQASPPPAPQGGKLARQLIERDLTRAVTVEQNNQNRIAGSPLRFGEVRESNVESRTIAQAFASENPL